MSKLEELVQERDCLKLRVNTLISLLKEAHESVGTAIGLELEYADYSSADRLRILKRKIEEEITKDKNEV